MAKKFDADKKYFVNLFYFTDDDKTKKYYIDIDETSIEVERTDDEYIIITGCSGLKDKKYTIEKVNINGNDIEVIRMSARELLTIYNYNPVETPSYGTIAEYIDWEIEHHNLFPVP